MDFHDKRRIASSDCVFRAFQDLVLVSFRIDLQHCRFELEAVKCAYFQHHFLSCWMEIVMVLKEAVASVFPVEIELFLFICCAERVGHDHDACDPVHPQIPFQTFDCFRVCLESDYFTVVFRGGHTPCASVRADIDELFSPFQNPGREIFLVDYPACREHLEIELVNDDISDPVNVAVVEESPVFHCWIVGSVSSPPSPERCGEMNPGQPSRWFGTHLPQKPRLTVRTPVRSECGAFTPFQLRRLLM